MAKPVRSSKTKRLKRFTLVQVVVTILHLTNVQTYYGESHVLRGLSLQVKSSQVVALLGRNGMGKTTAIRSITGLTPPRYGAIEFRGENVVGKRPHEIARRGIGLVPQGRGIFGSLSVEENLKVVARNGNDKKWSLQRIYELFPVLQERAHVKGRLLSGGQQSLLAIARALMTNASLLLMDEPSEGLSPTVVNHVIDALATIKEGGQSILLVEQHLPMALAIADYIYIIRNGEMVHSATPEELKKDDSVLSRYLGVGDVAP